MLRIKRKAFFGTGLKAMMTVEAAILIPFLMVITVTAISYIVFVCNRSMLIQDANAACADVQSGNNETDLSDHPYFMLEDISITVTEDSGKLTVKTSGNWNCPFWQGFSAELSGEETVLAISPVKVMRITKDILEKKERLEGQNVQDRTDQ